MRIYLVRVLREAGKDPITGHFTEEQEETLNIEAETRDQAARQSYRKSTIQFRGQERRTFVDGVEYFDSRF